MKIGDTEKFSKTITETDVLLFAGITGDFNPVHIDDEYAKETIFKKRIAHGMLTASFISTILGTKLPGPGTIFVQQNVEFKKPVYIGDTLKAKVCFTEIINYKKGLIKLDNIIKNQHNEIVAQGQSIVKVDNRLVENI